MNEVVKTSTNKVINIVNLAGRDPIFVEMAVGKSRGLKLREMVKEIEKIQKTNDEEATFDSMCECISEFSNFETGEQARENLTELEIMDLYLAIRGDIESTGRLFTLAGKSK